MDQPMMRVLAVIPARAGSKGLPGKHLMRLGGQTLIERAIRSAHQSTLITYFGVSSNDPAVRAEAAWFTLYIVIRPNELADDTAGMIPVLQHALAAFERRGRVSPYDLIVCLQPTSPFRTSEDIDTTIRLVTETGADSAQTLVEAAYSPYKMSLLDQGGHVHHLFPQQAVDDGRRQDCAAVQPSGSVYVTRREVLMAGRLIGKDHRGWMVPWERSVNINTIWDFKIAEMILANR